MTFLGILVWSPLFLVLAYWLSPKEKQRVNLLLALSGLIVIAGLALFSYALILPEPRFQTLVTHYLITDLSGRFSIWEVLRTLRNSFLILFFGYSPAALLSIALAGFYFLKQRYWSLIISALIVAGVFYSLGACNRQSSHFKGVSI